MATGRLTPLLVTRGSGEVLDRSSKAQSATKFSTVVRGERMTVDQVRAGIDWLTMTLGKDRSASAWWMDQAIKHIREMTAGSYQLKQYRMQGYDGFGAGGCFVGERETDYIAQFSGHYADDAFWALARDDAHCSRIDLRVDVKYKVMPQNIAKGGYRNALTSNAQLPAQRRRKIYLIVGSDGGDTLYLGAPSSEQRGRLYNKEIQSEDPLYSRTWRYECVYRNDSAQRVVSILRASGATDFDVIRSIVSTWYRDRGVSVKHFGGNAVTSIPLTRTIPTDVEKRLSWLRNQVAPALKFLQEQGASAEMMDALGITLERRD